MPDMTRTINTGLSTTSVDEDGWARVKAFDSRAVQIGAKVRVGGTEPRTTTITQIGAHWSSPSMGGSGYWCRLA